MGAWPEEWNASFKLHALQNTTVVGRIQQGRIIDLKVTPASRRDDVIIRGNGEKKKHTAAAQLMPA